MPVDELGRETSHGDARYLRITLTGDARAQLGKLSAKRQALSSTRLDGFERQFTS